MTVKEVIEGLGRTSRRHQNIHNPLPMTGAEHLSIWDAVATIREQEETIHNMEQELKVRREYMDAIEGRIE